MPIGSARADYTERIQRRTEQARSARPKPAGRPQNAERPARGASPPAGLQGAIRGRPRLAVICHQAGSRAQEALRWLAGRCGKDPSTMPGTCAAKARSPCAVRGPKTRKGPQGKIPLRAFSAHAVRGPGAMPPPCARIEKRPPRARRPALPQPCAAVLSAKAGLTAGFGMGPGDPRLCGRARGGRSPAALIWSLPGTPHRGDPGGRMAGTDRRLRIALGACHRGCEELGLLVPLG